MELEAIGVDLLHINSWYLTHFQSVFRFYTPWKHQKTGGFLMYSVGLELEQWLKMSLIIIGQLELINIAP